MSRTPTAPGDSALRAIPAVERILSGAALAPLIASYGRARVKEALTAHLDTLRAERASWDEPAAIAATAAARKSTRLNSSHTGSSYAVFCLKKKKRPHHIPSLL